MPKFALFVRANRDAESGVPPTTAAMQEMLTFNESLVKAGILVAGEGLLPSSRGTRVSFTTSGDTSVAPGPFEVETLVSGFWVIKAANLDEATGWARKVPFKDDRCSIEVRQVAGEDDFGDQMPDELKAKEGDLRKQTEGTGGGSSLNWSQHWLRIP
ncbi:hypothetical protein QBC33DRAFT_520323 [Phialemonium atrogriseum]|uniref:YCII-related domain-containing protein n=1 Tax=Phialemonium atrogriseum TaxID=1093897 RepID=A0AAJ0FTF9_9PEZI|nr:uncharacterized protein QBC33DRAFT_520323 [Phialemonium atrogriseum]KAK1772110.1 hypothetical protein QBC33DRAFT_520323 [Phialemonium atrogriseum]